MGQPHQYMMDAAQGMIMDTHQHSQRLLAVGSTQSSSSLGRRQGHAHFLIELDGCL